MTHTLEWIIIDGALRLIEDKRSWTRHAVTRRSNGMQCHPSDEAAMRYCAFGALVKSAMALNLTADSGLIRSAEMTIASANGWSRPTRIASINDREGHRAIVRAMKQALDTRS